MRESPAGEPDRSEPASRLPPDATATGNPEAVVDAVLTASRVLLGVAARSLGDVAEEVTLPQYRTLVILAAGGPARIADLADALDVTASTASRMSDRLVRKGLVHRARGRLDRRIVRLALTSDGRDLVDQVTARRRSEIARILRDVPAAERQTVVRGLRAFATASGEVPDRDWKRDL